MAALGGSAGGRKYFINTKSLRVNAQHRPTDAAPFTFAVPHHAAAAGGSPTRSPSRSPPPAVAAQQRQPSLNDRERNDGCKEWYRGESRSRSVHRAISTRDHQAYTGQMRHTTDRERAFAHAEQPWSHHNTRITFHRGGEPTAGERRLFVSSENADGRRNQIQNERRAGAAGADFYKFGENQLRAYYSNPAVDSKVPDRKEYGVRGSVSPEQPNQYESLVAPGPPIQLHDERCSRESRDMKMWAKELSRMNAHVERASAADERSIKAKIGSLSAQLATFGIQ